MSKKDYSRREAKKPKKESKKLETISFEPQIPVEVIKKGKKPTNSPDE